MLEAIKIQLHAKQNNKAVFAQKVEWVSLSWKQKDRTIAWRTSRKLAERLS